MTEKKKYEIKSEPIEMERIKNRGRKG